MAYAPTARALVWLLLAAGVFRLGFSFALGPVPQEAYYFFYAEHPSLSYFDHPPAVAWLLWGASAIFGRSLFALRFAAFAATALTVWVVWLLSLRILGRAGARGSVSLFALTGATTVTSLVSTPDVPLILFWSAALLQLHRALFGNVKRAWLWAGLFMGLSFDSKYTGCFLQLGLLLFLLASSGHRRLLRTRWPYLSVLIAHLTAAPVYLWNAQNGFASFLFQSADRASSARGPGLQFLLELLGTQSALITPVLVILIAGAVIGCVKALIREPGGAQRSDEASVANAQSLFLLVFCAPMLVLFTGISLFTLVKPNWLLAAYVSASLLVARTLEARWFKAFLGTTALIMCWRWCR